MSSAPSIREWEEGTMTVTSTVCVKKFGLFPKVCIFRCRKFAGDKGWEISLFRRSCRMCSLCKVATVCHVIGRNLWNRYALSCHCQFFGISMPVCINALAPDTRCKQVLLWAIRMYEKPFEVTSSSGGILKKHGSF